MMPSGPVALSMCRFRRRLRTQVCPSYCDIVIGRGGAVDFAEEVTDVSFMITDLKSILRFSALLKLSLLMNPS